MKKPLTVLIASLTVPGCITDETTVSTTTAALSDPLVLPPVPGIDHTPAGYGHYCSVTDPTNGGWALGALPGNESQPCHDMERRVGENAVVQRAGLWAVNGNNNVMVRCDGGMILGRGFGESVISWAYAQISQGDTNCIFTIAPTKLPAFGPPYAALSTYARVFDYNYRDSAWDVAEFGMPGTGKACSVDRTGAEKGTLDSNGICQTVSMPGTWNSVETAYDWAMPLDAPILAVADGVIRRSYTRNTAPICNGSNQLELFLETEVGTWPYSEHFVATYHHMNPNPNPLDPGVLANIQAWGGPMAPEGTIVKKGDVIAYNGTSGCSTGPHLHFSVLRLTNLTGARAYTFQALDTIYDQNGNVTSGGTGVNGTHGIIDPFGWAAPRGVDPMAYRYLGVQTSDQPAAITDAGAFSINLWDDRTVFDYLPHNGGDSF